MAPALRPGDEPIGFVPAFRRIVKLALAVGIGARRGLPLGHLQLLYQTPRLASRDDKLHATGLVGDHGIPTIESRIGAGKDPLHLRRQCSEHPFQVSRDLRSGGAVSIV